ncbi:unnamed protein product [Dibothriocephalus latus]|uniref:Uncharacterized protein n=1 Tax=Dibothriocephalus latus TaxID=60516 RepID=A0A3P7LQZ3_DIBLA|nr:unnamed protein product [Dibothriocephalus latus]
MRAIRAAGAAVALSDGRVFVAGGFNSRELTPNSDQASVEFCNLQSHWEASDAGEFWRPAAPMINARNYFAMVYFKGKVIAAGGGPEGKEVEVFTPPDADHPLGQWALSTPMSTLRSCSALLICNSRLFAFGIFISVRIFMSTLMCFTYDGCQDGMQSTAGEMKLFEGRDLSDQMRCSRKMNALYKKKQIASAPILSTAM